MTPREESDHPAALIAALCFLGVVVLSIAAAL